MLFCCSLLLHLEKNETSEVIDVQHSIGYSWRPIYATLSFLCVDVERAEVVVGGEAWFERSGELIRRTLSGREAFVKSNEAT